MTSINAGISPVDRVFQLRLEKKAEEAGRLAMAILRTDPHHHEAALFLAQLLVDQGRGAVAGMALARVSEAFLQRGDLPSATVAAKLAGAADEDVRTLLSEIAKAFGKGSPRLQDGTSPSPPPLPKDPGADPAVAKLSGTSLWDQAEKVLGLFLQGDDSMPSGGAVPSLPLFSSLAPQELVALLDVLEIRDVGEGVFAIRQGEAGENAFVVVRGMLKAVRDAGTAQETVLAALGPGAIVGEMALVSEAPRAASVIAVEGTRLLVASRHHLETLAGKIPAIGRELGGFCHGRMLSNLVRSSPLFAKLAADEQQDLITHFVTRSIGAGEVLIHHGSEKGNLYLLASGAVQVLGR
ncbi:MAG: cyclic nucleotide-binding domain-containing protein, partial [Myxococcales bacterium]|nr:cyclic nucleotide-binding domain-containing protein [Myxococcales bacterium]